MHLFMHSHSSGGTSTGCHIHFELALVVLAHFALHLVDLVKLTHARCPHILAAFHPFMGWYIHRLIVPFTCWCIHLVYWPDVDQLVDSPVDMAVDPVGILDTPTMWYIALTHTNIQFTCFGTFIHWLADRYMPVDTMDWYLIHLLVNTFASQYICPLMHSPVDTFACWYIHLVHSPVGTLTSPMDILASWHIHRLIQRPFTRYICQLVHLPVDTWMDGSTFTGYIHRLIQLLTGYVHQLVHPTPRPTLLHRTSIPWPTHLLYPIPRPTRPHHTPDSLAFHLLYSTFPYYHLYYIYPSPSLSLRYTRHSRPTPISWYNYCHGP